MGVIPYVCDHEIQSRTVLFEQRTRTPAVRLPSVSAAMVSQIKLQPEYVLLFVRVALAGS